MTPATLPRLVNSLDADFHWLSLPFAHLWPEEKAAREIHARLVKAEIERRFPEYFARRWGRKAGAA